jgi:hypothetical protein
MFTFAVPADAYVFWCRAVRVLGRDDVGSSSWKARVCWFRQHRSRRRAVVIETGGIVILLGTRETVRRSQVYDTFRVLCII